jgi:hypothetical protein
MKLLNFTDRYAKNRTSQFSTLKTPWHGDLYAAQTVGVGFLSSPGEGAASWETTMKINVLLTIDSLVGV